MRKPFYFTKRKLKSGKTSVSIVFNDFSSNRRLIFAASSLYKQYYKEAPEKLIAMPTEDCWRKSTLNTIALWAISSGLVSFEKCKGEEILFKDYAIKFWSFEESDYVARKNAEKKDSLHKTYVKDMLGVLRKHILSRLPEGLRLSDLEPSHAERIKDAMLKDGISNSMVNKAMGCIRLMLEEAYRLGYIDKDKGSRIVNVQSQSKKRGILTTDETRRLLQWLDEHSKEYERYKYLTVRFAIETGCREGEIVALCPSCFKKMPDGSYTVFIKSSVSEVEGKKSTKNGESRFVTVSSVLGDEILEYAKMNPYLNQDGYIFFAKTAPEKPILKKKLREDAFYWALYAIGIDEEERKARNLVFHSERHFAATRLAQFGDSRQIKLATGHKSDAVFNLYAGHQSEEDIEALNSAREKAFEGIL